jgi:Ca2+-binding EF-hand superfamily protein
LEHFDINKNGSVSFNEFLIALKVSYFVLQLYKGKMNEKRRASVRAAYEKLDVNKDGQVTLKDVA